MNTKKIKETLKRWNAVFCRSMTCKTNMKRDAFIVLGVILISIVIISGNRLLIAGKYWLAAKNEQGTVAGVTFEEAPANEAESVQKQEIEVKDIIARIDTSSWTPYQNTWFGLSLKYPNNWSDPIVQKPLSGVAWDQRIQFRMAETSEENPFEGFNVEVYSISKVKQISGTDEFPRLKNAELAKESECATIEGHLLETGEYPAEEIYIPANDACYNATLFFTNTRETYIYTISPKLKDGMGLAGDPADEIKSHMPEFFAAASAWSLIDIQRPKPNPKPVATKPRITAPKPASYAKDSAGRLVCEKKNDKPGKSDKGKGRHLDMECCLDPDEYPNPHCYYDPEKYGKYL